MIITLQVQELDEGSEGVMRTKTITPVRLPLNQLTWPEIARMIIVRRAYEEMDGEGPDSAYEARYAIKGKYISKSMIFIELYLYVIAVSVHVGWRITKPLCSSIISYSITCIAHNHHTNIISQTSCIMISKVHTLRVVRK